MRIRKPLALVALLGATSGGVLLDGAPGLSGATTTAAVFAGDASPQNRIGVLSKGKSKGGDKGLRTGINRGW